MIIVPYIRRVMTVAGCFQALGDFAVKQTLTFLLCPCLYGRYRNHLGHFFEIIMVKKPRIAVGISTLSMIVPEM